MAWKTISDQAKPCCCDGQLLVGDCSSDDSKGRFSYMLLGIFEAEVGDQSLFNQGAEWKMACPVELRMHIIACKLAGYAAARLRKELDSLHVCLETDADPLARISAGRVGIPKHQLRASIPCCTSPHDKFALPELHSLVRLEVSTTVTRESEDLNFTKVMSF
jgi:hypothetical protein